MPRKGVFSEEEEAYLKDADSGQSVEIAYKPWRAEWKRKGPIEFANQVLQIDPKTGKSLLLSQDQINFLLDICINGVKYAIISAGRGTGKSFVLAVYVAWRIYTHEYYNISVIGGSEDQAKEVQNYIKGWIRNNKDMRKFTLKNIRREIKTFANCSATFKATSETSVRGPHVNDIIIDEEAAADKSGKTEEVKAAIWEVSTSSNAIIIKSSTPTSIAGDYIETWENSEKMGYKRYQWSIAKYINKNMTNPYLIYKDSNPFHWFSNAPWITDEAVQALRRQRGDEEWLSEGLGCFSIASGLVFKTPDIVACTCDKCQICEPYKSGIKADGKACILPQYYLAYEGMKPEDIPRDTRLATQYIGERIEGIDWGQGVAPDAYSVIGRYKKTIFVFDFKELQGQTLEEKTTTAINMANKWGVEIFRPDPAQDAYNEILRNQGFTLHELWSEGGGQDKEKYILVLKKVIEDHTIKIPKKFSVLLSCLKNLTYEKGGKIRKVNDHAFDSLLYAVSYYGELDEGEDFAAATKGGTTGAKIWQPPLPKNVIPEPEEGTGENDKEGPTKEDDFNPFDEDYLRKRRGDEDVPVNGLNFWWGDNKPKKAPSKTLQEEFGDKAEG